MVPLKTIKVALPADMRATTISILDIKEQPLDGSYTLYPAQPAQPMSLQIQDVSFVPPDPATYDSNQVFPVNYLELTGQNDLAGQSMAALTVYPVHYYPATQKLTLVTSLTFTVEGVAGYVCGDYLPDAFTSNSKALYQQLVKKTVINPQDVQLRSVSPLHRMGVDPGNYEYVIITQDSWVNDFQPLREWKTKKGVPATIVTTSWIYNDGGYSGTNVEQIKAFVQDAYTNWGTIYVLLGGDTDVVPCNYKTFPSVDSDPVPNDAFYADFDTDWVCEVNVGRASVTGPGSGTGQIGNFINKVLNYETNPPRTEYATNAGFFGFDLDASTPAEQCKIGIDSSYIPAGWTTTTVYDSQGGNHQSDVITAMNAGQNLLNHADHSSSNFMGTGYVNHGLGIGNTDMDDLTNGNKQGILYSMGCDPAAFDTPNSIAEHFVRNSNGGGVAFIGNSRYGWYNPGNVNTLSMEYDAYFFRSIFQESLYNLGVAFSDHKDDGYQNNAYYKYVYTELTLLGDPELPIWTEDPVQMETMFPAQISVGTSDFTVAVSSGGFPLEQAYVCLWKGDEVYQTGLTDSAGVITFSISPSTQGSMFVTVTKHNYLPFEGSTLITSGSNNPPRIPSKPTGFVTGQINTDYVYESGTTDPEGDQVYYQWSWGNGVSDWMGPYPSGQTISLSHSWPSGGTYEVKVKAKDIFNAESEWSSGLFVNIIGPKANLSLGAITGGFLQASAVLENVGEVPATNIQWSLSVSGRFVLAGHTQTGSIQTLEINSEGSLLDSPILGFGPVTITANVNADGIPEMTKTAQGFLLFFYLIV